MNIYDDGRDYSFNYIASPDNKCLYYSHNYNKNKI